MTSHKIHLQESLKNRVERWREKGEKVVFTNGCFDILHLGHIDYLEKAKALGNKLIVALNSDRSVRKLKGDGRPINKEHSRARMLAALAFVDGVVIFDEQTPLEIIMLLKPDILVKGSDYEIKNIVGADFVLSNGGQVKTIDLVQGYSTTKIIEKIAVKL
ncbi:MAG: D-glycero-beta-D-manno-heptose 1-phosphate adenylyltransferase [Bacteroidetes bacterium]|nr:MAG: D-glycero-beta-D-manno-heptose 1-phosphate adenylyltransferase [Bacteroidota bacterium]